MSDAENIPSGAGFSRRAAISALIGTAAGAALFRGAASAADEGEKGGKGKGKDKGKGKGGKDKGKGKGGKRKDEGDDD